MKPHDIIIAGRRISFDASHALNQSYETFGGVTLHRMLDGAGVQQVHWRKVRTVISGSGPKPPGLDGINFDSAITIECAAPLNLSGASNIFTLPAARRADWAPLGFALVDGTLRAAACSVVGNTATVTTTPGASAYEVSYWPILTVIATPPALDFAARGTVAGWSLTAEEV